MSGYVKVWATKLTLIPSPFAAIFRTYPLFASCFEPIGITYRSILWRSNAKANFEKGEGGGGN